MAERKSSCNELCYIAVVVLNILQLLLVAGATAVITNSVWWWAVAGAGGVLALLGGGVVVMLKFKFSSRLILKQFHACPLSAHAAPVLNELLGCLAQRAKLPAIPVLYYVPSATVNAFAVGTRYASAVAITDAMLRFFSPREIAGVFAHEVSHIRINDLWVVVFADLCSRLARMLSTAGQILLLLNLPLLMFTSHGVSWAAILVLVFMPLMGMLVQLSLSRAREYNADLGAVELTGDPRGLMMALGKMERYHRRSSETVRLRNRSSKFSWLRTHPLTEKRIERLRRIEPVTPYQLRAHTSKAIRRACPTTNEYLPECQSESWY